ncbi:protoporphyrinogen oxidase [Janibacter sp. G56]|uniref:protoporphyrinogen oxidase n=1 Tax=Janibacter sp. G56 TaxID=3418717 RepID=UPI003CFF9A0F
MSRVIVIGAGVAGLSCARALLEADPATDVVVLEGSPRVGGKLHRAEVAGVRADVGAESIRARGTDADPWLRRLGLGDLITHPRPVPAAIWSRGRLHPVPRGTLMGVPGDPETARGLLTDAEVDRLAERRPVTPLVGDASVAEVVAGQVGRAVVDRIVEPLFGGVYAGRPDDMSLAATMPALHAAAVTGESLLDAAAAVAGAGSATRESGGAGASQPMVLGLVGGTGGLADALADDVRARGGRIELSTTARGLHRRTVDGADAWEVVTGPVPDPRSWSADAVVIAVPAAPASRLLRDVAPAAAAELAGIESASMAVLTFALPRTEVGDLPGSGFLVPSVDGHTIKASTFSSGKWAWVDEADPDLYLLRASIGRAGEVAALQRDDEDLLALALAEVGEALGRQLPAPVATHVQRWGGGLPQYAVGHRDRVATVRADVARHPGLAVAGAAYDGVGIAAVITTGERAAADVLAYLAPRA